MTRMREAAPQVASALVIIGGVALLVMTSRTGWLYAALAAIALTVLRAGVHPASLITLVRRAGPPVLLAGSLLAAALVLSGNRAAFEALTQRVGFSQAIERVGPILAG
jgi:hypothetical protein